MPTTKRRTLEGTSHLFLVRLWVEVDEPGPKRWCGKVQHVVPGHANSFCDWHVLISHLQAALPALDNGHEGGGEESRQVRGE